MLHWLINEAIIFDNELCIIIIVCLIYRHLAGNLSRARSGHGSRRAVSLKVCHSVYTVTLLFETAIYPLSCTCLFGRLPV